MFLILILLSNKLENFDCLQFLDPFKIESDPYGNKLYYGGDSLGEVERENKWLVNKGRTVDLRKTNHSL